MTSQNEIIAKLKEIKPTLKNEYSVKSIGLFGSFSENLQSETSDIDILVEFERPIGWKFFSLEIYLEKVFGRNIDLVTKNALKDQIRDQILEQVKFV